jgi:hypothetical protein
MIVDRYRRQFDLSFKQAEELTDTVIDKYQSSAELQNAIDAMRDHTPAVQQAHSKLNRRFPALTPPGRRLRSVCTG